MEQRISTSLQQRWLSKLIGFDYTIRYKKGKENHAADALSRVFEETELGAILQVAVPTWKLELQESLTNDTFAQEWIAKLLIDPTNDEGYSLVNGDLKKDGRYYVGMVLS